MSQQVLRFVSAATFIIIKEDTDLAVCVYGGGGKPKGGYFDTCVFLIDKAHGPLALLFISLTCIRNKTIDQKNSCNT